MQELTDGLCISRKSKSKCGTMPVASDSHFYKMDHTHRGRCIIFNIMNFESHTRLPERSGSDSDAIRLHFCFQSLGFDVTIHKNSSKSFILSELKKVSKEDHRNNDTFVCIILTHGDQAVVYGCDGKFNVAEIYEPFLGDVCPSLAGKPKLFFIQACLGDHPDRHYVARSMDGSDSCSSFRIPCFADFFVANSTVPCFYSWRNTNNGSLFIQALCSVFEQHGKEKELLEMMTMVNRNVACNFECFLPNNTEIYMKPMPNFSSMLTRKIYFTPKG